MAHGRPAVPRTGSEKSEIRAGAQRTLLQSQETDRHQGHARATERASALASMNPLVPPPSGRPQGFHTACFAGTTLEMRRGNANVRVAVIASQRVGAKRRPMTGSAK